MRGVKEEHYAIYNENPNITVLGRTFMCVCMYIYVIKNTERPKKTQKRNFRQGEQQSQML